MTRRTSRRRTSRAASRRRTSLRRNASSIANTFFTVFSGILTQEDQKMMARETKRGGRGNIYRLGHYLKALRNIEDSVRGFQGDDMSTAIQIRAAIEVNFTPGNPGDKLRKVVDAYLEHGTLPKYPVQKKLAKNGLLDACTYCKASPGGKHKWWCKTLAKNGRHDLRVGDVVTLPAGHKVGMGRLKTSVRAKIYHIQDQENAAGEKMYGVEWEDAKTGKLRGTWITEAEIT